MQHMVSIMHLRCLATSLIRVLTFNWSKDWFPWAVSFSCFSSYSDNTMTVGKRIGCLVCTVDSKCLSLGVIRRVAIGSCWMKDVQLLLYVKW